MIPVFLVNPPRVLAEVSMWFKNREKLTIMEAGCQAIGKTDVSYLIYRYFEIGAGGSQRKENPPSGNRIRGVKVLTPRERV